MHHGRTYQQIFSETVATALEYYKLKNYPEFENSDETVNFCRKINCLFDSLNNLNPYHGLSVDTEGWKNIRSSIKWLDDWEMALKEGEITEEEFLPPNTSQGLRITMSSMLDMSLYLIDKFDFKYILSGRINQDNLEKFFGTIRAAGGQNDHPAMPNFQHIYKMLSVYSILKPPKSGNCTVIEHNKNLISLEELKNIFNKPKITAIDLIKEKLNEHLLNIDDIHEIEVFDIMSESSSPFNSTDVVDCIIYYIAGYFTKQVSTIFYYTVCFLPISRFQNV
uniref:Transposable element P transposase n=1 Tax=Schizaphis graminum TaxID=13262 RepID=A0A2S2NJ01_SCHGA